MSKIVSRANTPEFNAHYDEVFNVVSQTDLNMGGGIRLRIVEGYDHCPSFKGIRTEAEILAEQEKRLAKLNKSLHLTHKRPFPFPKE